MQLIDNWKSCWKLSSFQIAFILIILETLQQTVDLIPEPYAGYIRSALIGLIPVARLLKQNIKD